VVGRVHNSILEAAGVLQLQVELAVLGVIRLRRSGTDVGLELVEAVGDDGLVGRGVGGDRTLGATVAGVGGADDGDLLRALKETSQRDEKYAWEAV
jgi:hypothetical protein